jgi:hypothetical protein
MVRGHDHVAAVDKKFDGPLRGGSAVGDGVLYWPWPTGIGAHGTVLTARHVVGK